MKDTQNPKNENKPNFLFDREESLIKRYQYHYHAKEYHESQLKEIEKKMKQKKE
jgi:hypothetical protein